MISVTAFGQAYRPASSPETFAPIPGFAEYSVSDRGTVKGPRGVMAPYDSGKGYRQIDLTDDSGRSRKMYVHRLVLLAHVGNPPSATYQAAHWNADRADNRLENLRWATASENAADKVRHRLAAITTPTIH